jgi:MFS family permease
MIDIEKIEKRTVQSFYEDGLTEIALGLIFLLLGAYFYATTVVPEGSSLGAILTGLFVLVVVSAGFLVNRFLRFFKRRVTYPRTGYVTFKKKEAGSKRRVATAVVAMIISAGLAALYGMSPSARVLFPAVNGLLFAVAVLLFANKVGLIRFFILAGASAVIGLGIAAAGIGDIKGLSLFYLIFGAAVIVSGFAALIVYLRRNPRPAAGGPEGPDVR